MKPVFIDPIVWAAQEKVLLSWVGTPYKWLQKAKGGGADCTTYITESFVESGFLERFDFPETYPQDWFVQDPKDDFIINHLQDNFDKNTPPGYKWVLEDPGRTYVRGDILLFKVFKKLEMVSHTTVYMGNNEMLHNVRKQKVRLITFDYRWKKYCTGVYRLYYGE